MPVTMICPNLNCRHTVVAGDSARGKIVRCAHCKQLFMVPERARPDVPLPADAQKPEGGGSSKDAKQSKRTE